MDHLNDETNHFHKMTEMNTKYDFKTDENGYLPLIQIRMIPLKVDLFENIKGLDEDRLFSVIENEHEMEIAKDNKVFGSHS